MPEQFNAQPQPPQIPESQAPMASMPIPPPHNNGKSKAVLILSIIAGLVLLGGVGFLAFKYLISGENQQILSSQNNSQVQNPISEPPVAQQNPPAAPQPAAAQPAPATAQVSTALEATVFTSDLGKFQIKFPKGWIKKDANAPLYAMFLNPALEPDGLDTNINVAAEPAHGLNLDGYLAANTQTIKALFPNYSELSRKKVTINSNTGYLVTLVLKTNTRSIQFYTVKNNQGYVVTITLSALTADKYTDLLNAVLGTFKPI